MATKKINIAPRLTLLITVAMLIALALNLSGCAYGLIYTSTTTPLVRNMRQSPYGETVANGDTQQISIPITPINLSATWNTRAIGDAARQAGLQEIYYADLRTISILLGLYQKKSVQVYGR